MAWLAATPKPDPRTRRGKQPEAVALISRLDAMKRDGIVPTMPPNPAPHIVDRLVEMGITETAGMGIGPISWQSIDAWCNRTGIDLPSWEAKLIRQLSVEYVAENRRAESENCPPPWRAEVTQREIEVEIAQLGALLG